MLTKRIENVQILMNDGNFRPGSVSFGETIQNVEVSETVCTDAKSYLIPGLIDVHTHGALGGDHTDGCPSKMQEMAKFYAKNGTTSFLATTLTATEETLSNAVKNAAAYERSNSGARCLGVHLEGPFFSYPKRGAHPADLLKLPDISMFRRLYELSGDKIKLISISPELDGAMEFIKEVSKYCRISLAHSACDYKTAMQAFASGATHVTHLFNGMNHFLHREPGIIGAAMDSGAFVEVICDGYHLHPSVIRAAFRIFKKRVCLISDSLRCAGLPDGDYESAGLAVTVKSGKVMLTNEGTLAGSTITLLQGVRNAVSLGIPLEQAVSAATINCAKTLGVFGEVGSIMPGAKADFVLLDSELNIKKVFIGGKEVLPAL